VIDQLLAQLKVGDEGAASAAQADIEPLIFRQIRDMAPDDPEVAGGLVRSLVAAGEVPEAQGLLAGLPEESAKHPAIARARAALELASAAPAVDTAALEARVAADPDDHQARFELAGAKAAAGDRDGAADALLEIVARDRDWNEGAARTRFLQLLEAQGLEDPWARGQRRRLSALLFT
jgi:putative thioredoxin